MLASLVMAEPDSGTCLSVQYKSREKEAEIAEAEEKFAESAPKNARVLVMKWPKTTTDHTDPNLKLNVQSAINRADVTLLPVVDLYQGGRVVPNTQRKPRAKRSCAELSHQRCFVPCSGIFTHILRQSRRLEAQSPRT